MDKRFILSRLVAHITDFGSNINKTGFVSELKSVISEFLQYDIDVKRLGEIRERVEDSRQLSAKLDDISVVYSAFKEYLADNDFKNWYEHNTVAHKVAGYRAVVISLKAGIVNGKYIPSGDMTDDQMFALADLADAYSLGEIRATHHQNLVLGDVKIADLYALWQELSKLHLARANIGTLTDMTVCPGFDYCALANATTHNIAQSIEEQFQDLDYLYDLGDICLNMSGCMNACAHHHVGDIGILGVDKKGEHWY